MKKTLIVTTLAVGLSMTAFAAPDCTMPPASKCFMMPDAQSSRQNITWISPTCCLAADNIKADVSSLNSKAGVLTSGKTAEAKGKTTVTYSTRGGDIRTSTVTAQ
jgi:hypothetical protein